MRLAAQEKHTCSWRPEQTKPQEKERKKKGGNKEWGGGEIDKWLEMQIKLADRQSVLTGKGTQAALFTWLTKFPTNSTY